MMNGLAARILTPRAPGKGKTAAGELGVSRTTLWKYLKKFHI